MQNKREDPIWTCDVHEGQQCKCCMHSMTRTCRTMSTKDSSECLVFTRCCFQCNRIPLNISNTYTNTPTASPFSFLSLQCFIHFEAYTEQNQFNIQVTYTLSILPCWSFGIDVIHLLTCRGWAKNGMYEHLSPTFTNKQLTKLVPTWKTDRL